MAESALAGVVVVEAGSSLATAYCGKLLADLGARVVILETAPGHPLRGRGRVESGLFAFLASNKESLSIEPSAVANDPDFTNLMNGADILVSDGTGPFANAVANAGSDRLVRVDISTFGRSGGYENWHATDFTTWAMGGYMYFTGEKSREPLYLPGDQADFHAGVHGAFASLAALYEQRRSGFGQAIGVSGLEAVLSAHSWLTVAWSHAGLVLDRSTHDLIKCADGWVCFMQLVMYPSIFFMIERPDLVDDPRWNDLAGWAAHIPEIFAMVAEWAVDKTRAAIVRAAQDLRIACMPLNDAKDLAESEQFAARQWWLEVEDPALGPVRIPGFPYKLSETPAAIRKAAPAVGEHAAIPPAQVVRSGAARPSEQPLKGLRVLELTGNWAGPVCGRYLADLGAEVIKVEGPTRPATRGGYWPKMDPQRQAYNRAGYFNQMNRNKRDVVLDLAAPAGKKAFIELAKRSDVFIENNSSRVMPNLGLGYDTLSKANPGLIMVSIAGSGASGPERDYVAFGSVVEASSGLASLVGYDQSQPYRTGFYYADPVAGAHAAVAVMAALEHRRNTGKGQWVDISLNECTAGFFAEALLTYQLTGMVPERTGNRSRRYAPQGAYRNAGIDNWMAISVQDDAAWKSLARVIGREDLASDAGLATLEGRQARADELDAAIRAWSSLREQYEATRELQAAGVAAAPVLANWQILADPHLYHRQFYIPTEHPVIGVYPYPGWPWKFSRTPAAVARYAPLFGEHNREIFREIGLGEAEIAALYESHVTSDVPIA